MLDAETQKQLAKAIIELAPVLAQDAVTQIQENKWVTPGEATKALGNGITAEILRTKVREGKFKYGKEYIDLSDGDRPTYAYKISKLRAYFETHPSKRGPSKVADLKRA